MLSGEVSNSAATLANDVQNTYFLSLNVIDFDENGCICYLDKFEGINTFDTLAHR